MFKVSFSTLNPTTPNPAYRLLSTDFLNSLSFQIT